jgi:hypothetical protein
MVVVKSVLAEIAALIVAAIFGVGFWWEFQRASK